MVDLNVQIVDWSIGNSEAKEFHVVSRLPCNKSVQCELRCYIYLVSERRRQEGVLGRRT